MEHMVGLSSCEQTSSSGNMDPFRKFDGGQSTSFKWGEIFMERTIMLGRIYLGNWDSHIYDASALCSFTGNNTFQPFAFTTPRPARTLHDACHVMSRHTMSLLFAHSRLRAAKNKVKPRE